MKILAIETSCDETAISIVDCKGDLNNPTFNILASEISSQVKLHSEFGGVVPNLAKREHGKNLPPILISVLKKTRLFAETDKKTASEKNIIELLDREVELQELFRDSILFIEKPDIDLLAVTTGPGLEPALWVGINFARALSLLWNIPLIGINHMEGHIVSPLLKNSKETLFPALALLISGGHTELVLVEKNWHYKKIGQTRDDAVGEAFDKVARLLDLPYPGGPEISRLAQEARSENEQQTTWNLPRPMINSKDLDFSFSGLKTAVLYAIKNHPKLDYEDKKNLAREFEDSVIEVLIKKTLTAIRHHQIKTLIIGGGVIANNTLRNSFNEALTKEHPEVSLLIPEISHATDNANMIAAAAYLRQFSETSQINPNLKANGNLSL